MSAERFSVECPGCGEPKRHYTTLAEYIGHSCSCSTTFSIDPETQPVGEVLRGGDTQRNGRHPD